MDDDERLVLLAWPRSGSSSLWEILQAHPDLHLMADEPFNESFTEWSAGNPDYLARVRDVESLDLVLNELFRTYQGIKVLSYQLDEEQLMHLAQRPGLRIIYISRRNLLQAAVSDRIAKQTRIYNRWDVCAEENLAHRYGALTPLDLDDLHSYVQDLASHLAWIDSLLSRHGNGCTLQLNYEDLYFADRESQQAQLCGVWSFLGLPPLSSPKVDYHLNPDTAKLGRADTYGQLPNAAEIDAALGADDTGWLSPHIPS